MPASSCRSTSAYQAEIAEIGNMFNAGGHAPFAIAGAHAIAGLYRQLEEAAADKKP
jgi:hypothetical protein